MDFILLLFYRFATLKITYQIYSLTDLFLMNPQHQYYTYAVKPDCTTFLCQIQSKRNPDQVIPFFPIAHSFILMQATLILHQFVLAGSKKFRNLYPHLLQQNFETYNFYYFAF